jgi:hypothetical protein
MASKRHACNILFVKPEGLNRSKDLVVDGRIILKLNLERLVVGISIHPSIHPPIHPSMALQPLWTLAAFSVS